MPPILQLALDFVDLHRAVNVAQLAVPEGVDIGSRPVPR